MKTTLAKLEEGYQNFTVGTDEPDFLYAHPNTVADILSVVTPIHNEYYGVNLVEERHGKRGTVYNNAIILPDYSLPEGVVRYENYSNPDNPVLNGVWSL